MGYSEIYCHICGVSFNIARRPKPGEPDLASWDYTGGLCDQPGVDRVDLEQCVRNGCFVAISYPTDDGDNILDDPDYVPPDGGDYSDPGEYDSEYESADSMSLSAEEDEKDINSDSGDDEKKNTKIDSYSNWLVKTWNPHARFLRERIDNFGHSINRSHDEYGLPIQPHTLSERENPELEQFPSETGRVANAYSGYATSPEEMIGCRTAQCLVHKSAMQGQTQHIKYYEPWEASEDWFLSGLSDGMPSRDCSYPEVWPAQGGVKEPRAENTNFDPESTPSDEWAMPFHPWCFDIFCRQSKARFNRINISGLMKWRNSEFSYHDFRKFPRSEDVRKSRKQFWQHLPGKEYLAANPLYVPGLPSLLLNAANEEENLSHDGIEGSQVSKRTHALLQVGHDDVFASMPPEICLLLVSFLHAGDLNNLRIASKVFTRLPNTVWWQLVQEEMPWLWESCPDSNEVHFPSFWTAVTANSLKLFKEERKRYSAQLRDVHTPTSEAVDFLLPFPKEVPDQLQLPRRNTNWHGVYTQIKKNWSSLRGLRNRQRIWKDVEEIIKRIEKYET